MTRCWWSFGCVVSAQWHLQLLKTGPAVAAHATPLCLGSFQRVLLEGSAETDSQPHKIPKIDIVLLTWLHDLWAKKLGEVIAVLNDAHGTSRP